MQCLFLEERTAKEGCVVLLAEAFRTVFNDIQGFLTTIAEPVSRLSLIHEYRITHSSLGTAVSADISAAEVVQFLSEHVYFFNEEHFRPHRNRVELFAERCMSRYNLARIVIDDTRTMLECNDIETANILLRDLTVRSLCAEPPEIVTTSARPYSLLRNRAVTKVVAERCAALGYPLQQQYDYERDTTIRNVNIALKAQTKPRPYQIDAVDAATADGSLRSGCIVLPCGAGKTLVGVMLLCKVKKPTLILCTGGISVEQWRNQILEFASLSAPSGGEEGSSSTACATSKRARPPAVGAARISCLTGKQKDEITDDTDIVLTTYNMLVTAHKMQRRQQCSSAGGATGEQRAKTRRPNPKERLFQPYGLLIMDEVHVMPADVYKESLGYVNSKGVIGLTATYVREDAKIRDLFYLVGPKLFDMSWERLASSGYLANVTCVEVLTPLTRQFNLEYMERSGSGFTVQRRKVPLLVMLAAANPNKMLCVAELVQRHIVESSKILVFCDHIVLLMEYGKFLGAPVICGDTPHRERLMIFSDFQSTSKVNVICLSRVGDVSVNLPSANVVIQVSSHGGSRRQEAQRLGRILRPKAKAGNGKAVDAWFYSVISTDTVEMSFAARRTAFLVDQGYTCRVMEFYPDDVAQTAPEVAEEPVMGDVVSIKQERLRGDFSKQRLKCSSPSSAIRGNINVRSAQYQLDLLARVVSNWEMDYHNAVSTQKGSGKSEGLQRGDLKKEVKAGVSDSPEAIKREWAPRAAAQNQGAALYRTSLQDLVGVSDDFIYHEL
uniref:DNA 3'-5' helicase n=1 Tax=Trypanosoma congolense (strain IL3000) TaxID=1068625 RepID=G0V385_TRYCI|nr:unnamed protein product [Trypanosoma congolense IL3000]